MYQRLRAIVLTTTRHTDRVNIITLYTDTLGRLALIAPAGGTSRTARSRRATLMPLTLIETDLNIRADRSMQRLGLYSLIRPNTGIIGNPLKSAIALFIADFLSRALRDAEPDAPLWQFINTTIATLDTTTAPANIHIAFLARYARYAGIAPDISGYTPHATFDMREGRYTDHTPLHPDILAGDQARAPLILSKLTYANASRLHIPNTTRRQMLRGIIKYYAIHLPGIEKLRSLDILTQLFAG